MNETPRTSFNRGRRAALRKFGMAAAAVAAPTILPSSVLAQATAQSKKEPPSERLNIALIGLGKAMDGHMRIFLPSKEIFIRAICDVDGRLLERTKSRVERAYRTAKAKGQYTGCLAVQDYNEVIAQDDIDGVVIATPVHWHAAIALAAIRSGKDVLCQSPMSLTVREGQLVADAADQYGAIVQVVAPQRSEKSMIFACELVRNGYIGEVTEVYAEVGQFNEQEATPEEKVPEGFDYDRWLGPAPWSPYHSARVASSPTSGWRRYWEYGDRKHGEVGFGHYDIIQWALGLEKTGPVEIVPKVLAGDSYASYRYAKGNGPVVRLDHPIEKGQDIQFVGSQGNLMVSSRGQVNGDPSELTRIDLAAGDIRLREVNSSEISWIQSMRTRRRPVADAQAGHRSSTICHLNALAERLGRAIKWDPEKEEILDDPIAARFLDRPRRAPYTLT